ncbi:Protein of unknown function [Rhizobiales bacterium GAS188]|nr:Protein of unknown function [Rhizobiales bacterium GAS188]
MIANPLSRADTDIINTALQNQSARVDAMDEQIIGSVYADLDKCSAKAQSAGRSIDPKPLIFMALWINMSGPPTKLLTWLSGGEPNLGRPVPPPGQLVTAAQMETYLRATDYYLANPGNIPHLLEAVAAGAALLPGAGAAGAALAAAAELGAAPYAMPVGGGDHLVYEQATGILLTCEGGRYDTLAVGYSGSLSKHGKNDPDQQCVRGVGPLPCGSYTVGPPGPGPSPYSLALTPDPTNDMCGRSGFLIHGDSLQHPGDASDGCIILKISERSAIVATGLKTLVVVARISA